METGATWGTFLNRDDSDEELVIFKAIHLSLISYYKVLKKEEEEEEITYCCELI